MRHRVKKHLHFNGKDKAHRKSMVRSLTSALFEHGAITTTKKRALALASVAEGLIEVAKGNHTEYNKIRLITPHVFGDVASRAVLEAGKTYADRTGGYTRITPIKYRDGDNALLVRIELV